MNQLREIKGVADDRGGHVITEREWNIVEYVLDYELDNKFKDFVSKFYTCKNVEFARGSGKTYLYLELMKVLWIIEHIRSDEFKDLEDLKDDYKTMIGCVCEC